MKTNQFTPTEEGFTSVQFFRDIIGNSNFCQSNEIYANFLNQNQTQIYSHSLNSKLSSEFTNQQIKKVINNQQTNEQIFQRINTICLDKTSKLKGRSFSVPNKNLPSVSVQQLMQYLTLNIESISTTLNNFTIFK